MFDHVIQAISKLQHDYPNVTITLISGSTTDLLDRLNPGELDFLFALDFTQKASYDYLDFPDADVSGVFINQHHPRTRGLSIIWKMNSQLNNAT